MNKVEKQKIYVQQVGLVASIVAISRLCGSEGILLINQILDTLHKISVLKDDTESDQITKYLDILDDVYIKITDLIKKSDFEYKIEAETLAEQIKLFFSLMCQKHNMFKKKAPERNYLEIWTYKL